MCGRKRNNNNKIPTDTVIDKEIFISSVDWKSFDVVKKKNRKKKLKPQRDEVSWPKKNWEEKVATEVV